MQVEDRSREDFLTQGRGAYAAARWRQAFEWLSRAESAEPLQPADLEMLAVATYLVGEDTESTRAWGRAHDAWMADAAVTRAARCAFWAGWGLFYKGQGAQAQGWFGTAQALIADHPDSVEHGLLLVPQARKVLDRDAETASGLFEQARSLGERFRDPDLTAFGLLGHGQALIRLGRVDDGVALLDRAMVTATSSQAMPMLAGTVYCAVLLECELLFDLARAREWTGVLQDWCSPDLVPFRGQCLVHRSELMQLDGLWTAAMEEAARACELLAGPPTQPAVGMAHYQRAELLRLQGAYDEALEAYQEANQFGHSPHPGLALLRLAQGDVGKAEAAIRRAVAGAPHPLRRLNLLSAAVEIALANDDVDAAREAAAELARMAEERQMPLLRARAASATAAVLLADGEPQAALTLLVSAREAWREIGSTFELARIRVVVGVAERALGDEAAARAEFESACRVFRELGAGPALERARRLSADAGSEDDLLTPREVEVLRLVAAGRSNQQVASSLVISGKTVERHLSNIYRKLEVNNRAAATRYWYEQGLG